MKSIKAAAIRETGSSATAEVVRRFVDEASKQAQAVAVTAKATASNSRLICCLASRTFTFCMVFPADCELISKFSVHIKCYYVN